MTDEAADAPDPTHERDKLVERLMRHREINREEAEALVEEHLQGRASDIDPHLLEDIDRS